VPGGLALGTNLAQRRICIKIDKKAALTINYRKK